MPEVTREKIERALQALLGLPLWDSGRAADLQWFAFGARRWVEALEGGTREVSEYALHVQCAWRIADPGGVVVGSHDLCYPPGEEADVPDDFDWDVLGGNRRDRRMAWFIGEFAPLSVTSVKSDALGTATIALANRFSLDLFPHDSFTGQYSERWRLFRPSTDEPHFVVTGDGIEE